jgi:hypothetical protein
MDSGSSPDFRIYSELPFQFGLGEKERSSRRFSLEIPGLILLKSRQIVVISHCTIICCLVVNDLIKVVMSRKFAPFDHNELSRLFVDMRLLRKMLVSMRAGVVCCDVGKSVE